MNEIAHSIIPLSLEHIAHIMEMKRKLK